MYTVIETHTFQTRAAEVWSPGEYEDFIVYIADHPKAGRVIAGTGGVRKIRWSGSGRGKRGGSRVIYSCNKYRELWLLTLYAKNQRESIPAFELKLIREALDDSKNV